MKINRLTVNNFGVYAGENSFIFANRKPIVLIGGMNGRGKTTFLEAILLALYGSNSIAYKESKCKSYNQYLRSYINKNHLNESCYIEIEFIMNESTNDTFMVRREWNAFSKITKETIYVSKNGEHSDFHTKNWSMFVENILPSALSSFYFFDGEKIAELAVDNTSEQMKESIRSMLGITVLDVLKNDIGRLIKKMAKKGTNDLAYKDVEKLGKERDEALDNINKIDTEIADLNSRIQKVNDEIENLKRKYEVHGGDIIEQRKELINKRSKLQADIDQNASELINIAASELPLCLVKDLIADVKLQAEDEHNDSIMQQAMELMDGYLEDYVDVNPDQDDSVKHFVTFMKQQLKKDTSKPIYEVSDHALFQMNGLMESLLDNSLDQVKEKLEEKKKLQKKIDEIDSYLSLDINENELVDIFKQIKEKENELILLQVDLAKLNDKRASYNSIYIAKNSEFNKKTEDYLQELEQEDDSNRVLKYSNMAINILDSYSVELQKRKTDTLAETITNCYKKLANKKNMIEKIIMNAETLDMQYLDIDGNYVSKASLSAGEKQLMVIAILWALALCSKKKLPVIVDTPLSRLDSQHRTSIITTYYPNASDQTIILSTDTEIDDNYYNMMKNYVGDEYTLVYDEECKSTSIKKGYFK